MPSIAFGAGAYKRNNGSIPEVRLKNMFLEKAVTEKGAVLLSRKGLTTHSTVGTNPIDGIFSQENVFFGDVFTVSGGRLYRGTEDIGPITGTGPVSFAAGTSDELAICAGESIHRYDGTTLVAVLFPDGADVSAIVFHDGLYLAVRAQTDQWYYSAVLDADIWDALDFSSAESKPDILRDIKVVGDYLYLMGSETIEKWVNSGEPASPYSRIDGAILEIGVMNTGCTVEILNTLIFIGNDGIVYTLSDSINRISDHGIEEKIAASATISAFGFILEGHPFFCLRTATGSYLYDASTEEWCEFTSAGQTNWRARCACMYGLEVFFGDAITGKVWAADTYQDDGVTFEQLFTASFPIEDGITVVDNLVLDANAGHTAPISAAMIEMRASRDSGGTWGPWRSTSMGAPGKYRARPKWTRCGMFDFPRAMFEIRFQHSIGLRVSNVLVNERGGGVSR